MIAKHSSPPSAGIACVHRDSREGMDGIGVHPKNRIRQAHDEDQGLGADGVNQAQRQCISALVRENPSNSDSQWSTRSRASRHDSTHLFPTRTSQNRTTQTSSVSHPAVRAIKFSADVQRKLARRGGRKLRIISGACDGYPRSHKLAITSVP